jgi:hypothetical protein
MASNGSSGPGGAHKVFQHTDPFHDDAVQRQRESDADQLEPATTAIDDEEGLRLAGVRSDNPFAASSTEETTRPRTPSDDDRDLVARRGQAAITQVKSEISDQLEPEPTSAISPGAGRDALPEIGDSVEPRDFASNSTSTKGTAEETGPESTNLQSLNSNTYQDRGERGTDIFANADPPTPEEKTEGYGPDELGSGSSSVKTEDKPRVAFTRVDKIDKTPTHDDSDEPSGILEKIKSSAKDKFHLLDMKATGPFKRLNPTNVRIRASLGGGDDDADREVGIIWRSRDNRKGRNSVVIPRTSMAYPNLPSKNRPVYSSSFKGVGRNLFRMAFSFPYWDMAFWSGWSYTWGSVLFVMDGVWAWGPVGWDVEWKPEQDYVIGIFFFVGALLYQVGAVMAYLEAVNDGSFHGSAMKRFLEGHEEDKKKMLDEKVSHFFGHLNPLHEKHRHEKEHAEEKRMAQVDPSAGWKSIHRRERYGSIYPDGKLPAPRRGGVDLGEAEEGESHEYLTWRWWPTWHALRSHHIYEIGYIACSIQLFGATLYCWCGLVSVPGISSEWKSNTTFYGGYWFPEVFGSCCFLSASVMFLMETQEHWWKIQPNIMGWWIGLWAMIGSLGFL